jgi:hypothetical protein
MESLAADALVWNVSNDMFRVGVFATFATLGGP